MTLFAKIFTTRTLFTDYSRFDRYGHDEGDQRPL